MKHRFRGVLSVVASVVLVLAALPGSPAWAHQGGALESPVPPGASDTFTWQVARPSAREDDRQARAVAALRGCWTAAQVSTTTAVDRVGKAVPISVIRHGLLANTVVTGAIARSRFPLRITVGFTAVFESAESGTTLQVNLRRSTVGGPTCEPPADQETYEPASPGTLSLAGTDTQGFVATGSSVRFAVQGAALSTNPTSVRVLRNGADVAASAVQLDSGGITLAGALVEGRNDLTVLAQDSGGKALSAEVTLWAGARTLNVAVLDAAGQPVTGAQVTLRLSDDPNVSARSVSDAGATAITNLPNRTVLLEAKADGNRFATAATYGAAGSITLRLKGLDSPSSIDNNDFSQGTDGWNVGSAPVQIVPHTEEGGGAPAVQLKNPAPRTADQARKAQQKSQSALSAAAADDFDLSLGTAGEGSQSVSRTFTAAPGTSSIRVRYRFITSEVPGGYYGSEYNDFFSVSIRTQAGGGAIAASNSMNGLGLAAFDAAGATAWREVTLPVNVAADTVQVDLTVANVADGLYDSQVVVDAVSETLTITADKTKACPNETVTFSPEGDPSGTLAWDGGGNPATGTERTFATRFPAAGAQTVRATLTDESGNTRTATKSVTVNEASGAAWVARFPTSTDTGDLVAGFGGQVNNFIAAVRAGGATVTIAATLRPPERAYLMHYSYRIAQQNLDPATVPPMAGVEICWLHRNADGSPDVAASRTAAQAMVNGYGIVYAPALQSRHTEGRAIDMNISWSGNLTVTNAAGTAVTITTTPRTGAGNTDLHTVGASYGVNKLLGDAPHWSDDGR